MNDSGLNVLVTIDVEEEGLFSGSYRTDANYVTNVKHLWKLDSVFREFGIPPTLLTSYQVAKNPTCKETLSILKSRWKAEIGAHLHHWNTDPILLQDIKPPVPSELIPQGALKAKTENLIRELIDISVDVPTSFRMGRFNFGPKMFSVIDGLGIKVDSSIAPVRSEYGGPDHLTAPSDPYHPDSSDPAKPGQSRMLEVPVTINPLVRRAGNILEKARCAGLIRNDRGMGILSKVLSIPVQPAWTSLNASKAGVVFHRMKGGRFLTIFFHSSELAPGLNPLHPTEEAVQRFLIKLRRFFQWLMEKYDTRFITLSQAPHYFESK